VPQALDDRARIGDEAVVQERVDVVGEADQRPELAGRVGSEEALALLTLLDRVAAAAQLV